MTTMIYDPDGERWVHARYRFFDCKGREVPPSEAVPDHDGFPDHDHWVRELRECCRPADADARYHARVEA